MQCEINNLMQDCLVKVALPSCNFCFQVGGVETVTLGDGEAKARRSQKTILERQAPPTFEFLIEMRQRHYWVTHQVCKLTY